MTQMGDMAFATKMRTLVMSLIDEAIDKRRPRPRYGKVYSIDREHAKCEVVLTGDENPVTVSMGAVQPRTLNQIVRVEGIGVDKYITDVIGGKVWIDESRAEFIWNDPVSNTTLVRSHANDSTAGYVIRIDNAAAGGILNNVWKWRFNSSGVLDTGSVPATSLSGSQVIAPYYAPCLGRDDNNGDTWFTSNRAGAWASGTRLIMKNVAIANDWHFGFWNANGTEEILVGNDGARYFRAAAIWTRSTTSGANVVVGPSGELARSTSLRAAKVAIEDAPEDWAEKFWNLKPRTWFDRADAERLAEHLKQQDEGEEVDWSEVMVSPLRRIPGFVAEEVEESGLSEFVTRDAEGEVTGLSYDRMLAAAVVAMKAERARADALEARLKRLEEALGLDADPEPVAE